MWDVTGLDGYTQYEYKVAGINILGVGEHSPESDTAKTLPIEPNPPTGLAAADVSYSSFNLTWMEPDNRGSVISGYTCCDNVSTGGSSTAC